MSNASIWTENDVVYVFYTMYVHFQNVYSKHISYKCLMFIVTIGANWEVLNEIDLKVDSWFMCQNAPHPISCNLVIWTLVEGYYLSHTLAQLCIKYVSLLQDILSSSSKYP